MNARIVRRMVSVVVTGGLVVVGLAMPATATAPAKDRPKPAAARPQAVAKPLPAEKVQSLLLTAAQASAASGSPTALSEWVGGPSGCEITTSLVECLTGWSPASRAVPVPYFLSAISYPTVAKARAGLAANAKHSAEQGWSIVTTTTQTLESQVKNADGSASFAAQVRKGRGVGHAACTVEPAPADMSALRACALAVATAQAAVLG